MAGFLLRRADHPGCLPPLTKQETGHASQKLESHRSMLVRVIPKGSSRMISRDIDQNLVRSARFHFPENIV